MAMIPAAFVTNLVGLLITFAKDEAARILGVPDEIQRLQKTLVRINVFLIDAEKRRFHEEAINHWLNELRDVMYDVHDIIDECRIEVDKHKASSSSSSSSSTCGLVCYSFPSPFSYFTEYGFGFRNKISKRIRGLIVSLTDIYNDKAALNLASSPSPSIEHPESKISRKTSPLVEPVLAGTKIEDDTRSLVELLTKEQKQQKKLPIFAITGMGGIGKTTLAQKIFNHEIIQNSFLQMPPVWVCVSQDFSEIDLLRAIVRQAGGNPSDIIDREELEPMLNKVVRGKRLFLVLDDMWDAAVWERLLRKPLQDCAPGSRVLITTRNEAIAIRMGTVHLHRVEKLSNEEGWSLLCKMVFEDGEEGEMQSLRGVGMRIVEKCGGLPLALRTIAGLLGGKERRESEWEKILHNQAWSLTELLKENEAMGALYVSYEDLSSPLKQCFVYFSLFREDELLAKINIACLWIAEGFIQAKEDSMMEEVAYGYWTELVQRGFLQPDFGYYEWEACKMHDFLRNLAQYLARDEYFYGDVQRFNKRTTSIMKTRRLSIENTTSEAISGTIIEQTNLRTLLLPNFQFEAIPESLFKKLACLRILGLGGTPIKKLPDSLGEHLHLRYLNLSGSGISELPKAIGNLRNLQFLILDKCKHLHNLPDSFVKLCNLRALRLVGMELNNMPKGIGGLHHLIELDGFVVNDKPCNLEELEPLCQLKSLRIDKLERASSRDEAKAAALERKPKLIFLRLVCSPDVQYNEENTKRIVEVFEGLRPSSSIERLRIHGYFGFEYPTWLMMVGGGGGGVVGGLSTPIFPNLISLHLIDCNISGHLPPLGHLPQLKTLRIRGAKAVRSIGPDFLLGGGSGGSSSNPHYYSFSPFPKLKYLTLLSMPNWEEWLWPWEEEEGGGGGGRVASFPRLDELRIRNCPKLISLPKGLLRHAAAMTILEIRGAHSLGEIEDLLSIKTLEISDNPNLNRICNLASLKILKVKNCRGLRDVESLHALQHLVLEDDESLSLPEWLLGGQLHFSALDKLEVIAKTSVLLSRCVLDGPDWPKIQHIPHVQVHATDGEYISYTKAPFTFRTSLTGGEVEEDPSV